MVFLGLVPMLPGMVFQRGVASLAGSLKARLGTGSRVFGACSDASWHGVSAWRGQPWWKLENAFLV